MKLSFQILQDSDLAGYIATSKSGGLKTINDPGLLNAVPSDWIKDARLMSTGEASMQGASPSTVTADQVVERYMNACAAQFNMAPADTYFEGPFNEPGFLEDPVWMQWYGDIEYKRQIAMHSIGKRAVIFNPSSQADIGSKVGPWKAAYLLAKQLGNAAGFHGYTSPHVNSSPELHTLITHKPVMDALGFVVNTIYTEDWCDRIAGVNTFDGWRTCLPQDQFIADTVTYDNMLMAYPEVLMSFIYIWTFQSGYEMYNLVRGNPHQEARASGEILVDYTQAHPYVGIQVPAPIPPPIPVPVPPAEGPNLVKNGDFAQGTYAIPGNPNQQRVPLHWNPINTQDQIELEQDPYNLPPGQAQVGRVYQAYTNRLMGLSQLVSVEPGARYKVRLTAKSWCTTNPVPHTPSDSPAALQIQAGQGGPIVTSSTLDKYVVLEQEVVAANGDLLVTAGETPVWPVTRSDIFLSLVEVRKIMASSPPVRPPAGYTGRAKATDRLNVRAAPVVADNVERVLDKDEPVRLTGVQQNGFAQIVANANYTGDVADGVKPIMAWASLTYLVTIGG